MKLQGLILHEVFLTMTITGVHRIISLKMSIFPIKFVFFLGNRNNRF